MQMSSMTYMLEDNDIIEDLKIINKNKAFSVRFIFFLKVYDGFILKGSFNHSFRCKKSIPKAVQVQHGQQIMIHYIQSENSQVL